MEVSARGKSFELRRRILFAVPMIALPMVGGTIANHFDRQVILKGTQSAMMLCAMALATLSLLRVITIGDIIAVSFLSAVAFAVDNPTRQALIPDLVPSSDLLSAISLNSVAFNGAVLLGPALSGAILGLAGRPVPWLCHCVLSQPSRR
jgi:MFS family permease